MDIFLKLCNSYINVGIEDKIISMRCYCCVVTNEGTGFLMISKRKKANMNQI